jgi:hypothetical protein
MLQEWLEREGLTFPAMLMEGALPNFFTINGKSYPATPTIHMRVGERLRVRFIGSHNNFIHPMHIHGGPFTIVQTTATRSPTAHDSSRTPEPLRHRCSMSIGGNGSRIGRSTGGTRRRPHGGCARGLPLTAPEVADCRWRDFAMSRIGRGGGSSVASGRRFDRLASPSPLVDLGR